MYISKHTHAHSHTHNAHKYITYIQTYKHTHTNTHTQTHTCIYPDDRVISASTASRASLSASPGTTTRSADAATRLRPPDLYIYIYICIYI
jgi:hypothetical protein